MVALGVAEEYAGRGITGNSLWPATVIESQASINFEVCRHRDDTHCHVLSTPHPCSAVRLQASHDNGFLWLQLGERSQWRKATILSDCVVQIVGEPDTFTGNMLIDDTYLLSKGMTKADLAQVRCQTAVCW